MAHKVYYEERQGPVPEGLELDHLCRVRACVNPDHLEPVTRAENVRRGARAKLSCEQAAKIRASLEAGTVLAAKFGVTPATISAIRRGKTW
jgi:hypothetical protein